MITRREMMMTLGGSALAAQLLSAVALAQSAETGTSGGEASGGEAADGAKSENPLAGDKGVTVRPILQHDMPDVAGKQISMVLGEFEPRAGSSAHRHPGSTIAYLLEGSVVSEVGPSKPVTFHAGQSGDEAPMPTP